MLISKYFFYVLRCYVTLGRHHIHIPLTNVGLSPRGKYSVNIIMNTLKHIVYLGSTQVCISICYLIQIVLVICSNLPEILKFPVPVHVVLTLHMLICIQIFRPRRLISK